MESVTGESIGRLVADGKTYPQQYHRAWMDKFIANISPNMLKDPPRAVKLVLDMYDGAVKRKTAADEEGLALLLILGTALSMLKKNKEVVQKVVKPYKSRLVAVPMMTVELHSILVELNYVKRQPTPKVVEIPFDNSPMICNTCSNAASLRCRCHAVFYCNSECQKTDWRFHKPTCLTSEKVSK